jgi:branched-subunit amino acid transport protein
MTVLLALVVASAGSLAFRVVPLAGAHRLPDRLTELAGWAGMSVLSALTVRAVLHHQDAAVQAAPLVAAASVSVCLVLRFHGRSLLLAVTSGAATYAGLAVLLPLLPLR